MNKQPKPDINNDNAALQHLPYELKINLLKHVHTFQDCSSLINTCSQWLTAGKDRLLWRNRFQNDFGTHPLDDFILNTIFTAVAEAKIMGIYDATYSPDERLATILQRSEAIHQILPLSKKFHLSEHFANRIESNQLYPFISTLLVEGVDSYYAAYRYFYRASVRSNKEMTDSLNHQTNLTALVFNAAKFIRHPINALLDTLFGDDLNTKFIKKLNDQPNVVRPSPEDMINPVITTQSTMLRRGKLFIELFYRCVSEQKMTKPLLRQQQLQIEIIHDEDPLRVKSIVANEPKHLLAKHVRLGNYEIVWYFVWLMKQNFPTELVQQFLYEHGIQYVKPDAFHGYLGTSNAYLIWYLLSELDEENLNKLKIHYTNIEQDSRITYENSFVHQCANIRAMECPANIFNDICTLIVPAEKLSQLPFLQDQFGKTPFDYACAAGNYHAMIYLLGLTKNRTKLLRGTHRQGMNTDVKMLACNTTPLQLLCESGTAPGLIKYLYCTTPIETYDLMCQDNFGRNALHYACMSGSTELVAWLLELYQNDFHLANHRARYIVPDVYDLLPADYVDIEKLQKQMNNIQKVASKLSEVCDYNQENAAQFMDDLCMLLQKIFQRGDNIELLGLMERHDLRPEI